MVKTKTHQKHIKYAIHIKYVILFLFSIGILACNFTSIKVNALDLPSEAEFQYMMSQLRQQFVDGEYWVDCDVDESKIRITDPHLVAGTLNTALASVPYPCNESNCGTYYYDNVKYSSQCMGYADLI
ncbi:MAG: hypothetical protein ACI4JK_01980 [Oscillospiraceae bacterium]